MHARRILLCFLIATASPAQAALLLNEVLDRMERTQETLRDVSFNFVERVRQGDFPEQKITGKVQARKPHALRVDQLTPDKQVLITNGETLWLYTPAQNQQLKGDWKAWVQRSRFPLLLIDFVGTFTPERWRNRYKVFFGGYEKHLYELRFKPIRAEDLPVTLWISEETFLPARGMLVDHDLRMEVELQGVRINRGVEQEAFVPKVPKGTQEIPITF